ncbi:hypothetical protein Bca4012_063306 [Brassica carinata]|uniref:Uncharacterized protein n=1 Tax=Brassica carinata TaxID=52824 RepID=A0A8X7V911_BRACI|nr:hypothetical protein Bca52824_033992 [Brassica carinata]
MDLAEEKRAKREMEKKKMREHVDMTAYVSDSHYGIPNRYPYGARVIDEVSTTNNSPTDHDTYPGSRYFSCKFFENNGRHFRQPWVIGVQEEIQRLKKRTNWMADEIDELKKLMR